MLSWLLFVRHAHRDTLERELDNGLSDKGHRQGLRIMTYLDAVEPPRRPEAVYSSPKIRCLETAHYVARWAGLKVQVEPRLDEQRPGESSREFEVRIESFFGQLRTRSAVCCVTHGDVLPLVEKLCGAPQAEIHKGDLFWVDDGKVRGVNAIQSAGKPGAI